MELIVLLGGIYMENRYHSKKRLDELKGRANRCCCKYCGGKLVLRRIIFNDDEDARIELFCSECNRIEYGVEPEIYHNAVHFVDYLNFDIFQDLESNEKKRKLNIAKICEIMAWGDKNLGLLQAEGFIVPVKNHIEVNENSVILTRTMLRKKWSDDHE